MTCLSVASPLRLGHSEMTWHHVIANEMLPSRAAYKENSLQSLHFPFILLSVSLSSFLCPMLTLLPSPHTEFFKQLEACHWIKTLNLLSLYTQK